MNPFFLGLDLGQQQDPTALVVLQRFQINDPKTDEERTAHDILYPGMVAMTVKERWDGIDVDTKKKAKEALPVRKFRYEVRHVQRFRLSTPYPDIVDHLVGMCLRKPLAGATLAVDCTGVGRPVVDMFRKAQTDGIFMQRNPFGDTPSGRVKLNVLLRPITITGGHKASIAEDGYGWHVPKKELAGIIQVLLDSQRLEVVKSKEGEALKRELQTFKVKIKKANEESFEAWRASDHDDLVLALGIAAWMAERTREFWYR